MPLHLSPSAERGIVSGVSIVLILACVVAFCWLYYLQAEKKGPSRHQPALPTSLPGLCAFFCFNVSVVVEHLRVHIVPYHKGPFRGFTPQEWSWRLVEMAVYALTVVLLVSAIIVAKRRRSVKLAG